MRKWKGVAIAGIWINSLIVVAASIATALLLGAADQQGEKVEGIGGIAIMCSLMMGMSSTFYVIDLPANRMVCPPDNRPAKRIMTTIAGLHLGSGIFTAGALIMSVEVIGACLQLLPGLFTYGLIAELWYRRKNRR